MLIDTQNRSRQNSIAFAVLMWLIAAVFYSLDYLQHTVPSVLIKPVADSMGMNYVDIATIMSVYFPVYAVSQIPAGYLIDHWGLKVALATACFVVSVGLLLMLAPFSAALLSGRVLIAIGSAFAFVGALKTASVWLPRKYFPIFVGLTQTFGVIGGLVGQVFIDYLIEEMGWRDASLTVVVFGVFWSVVILLFLKNRPRASANEIDIPMNAELRERTRFSHLLKNGNVWRLAIYAAIMVGVVMATFAELYDVVLLEKSLALTSQQATYITMFIFIGVGVGAPLHGLISNVFSSQRTWIIICAFVTFFIFMLMPLSLIWSFSQITLMIIYFFLGFFVSSMMLAFALAKCCYPLQVHGTIFAFINTIIGLAGFLFPLLFAAIEKFTVKHVHWQNELLAPLFLLAVPLILNLFLVFFIDKGSKKKLSH